MYAPVLSPRRFSGINCGIELMLMILQVGGYYRVVVTLFGGLWWRTWLRHCDTIQKVAGSIPIRVIGIFHSVALESTQPVTETSTRNIFRG